MSMSEVTRAPLDDKFITAGAALFSVRPPEATRKWFAMQRNITLPPHWTFRVRRKEGEWKGRKTVTYFVSVLTGTENTSWHDYKYVGVLNPATLELRLTKASKCQDDTPLVLVLRKLLAKLANKEEVPQDVLYHEGRCGRCGRVLTVPESIDRGIGPECFQVMQGYDGIAD